MDRSWMKADRLGPVYEKRVIEFLEYAILYVVTRKHRYIRGTQVLYDFLRCSNCLI